MKRKSHLLLLVLTVGLLSACTSNLRQAPVVDRSTSPDARPVTPNEEPKEDPKGMYTVKRGDTLIRIALDHGQNYRDLVAWNSLADPNDIKVGQVLRVAPPENAVVTTPIPAPEVKPVTPPVPKKTTPRGEKRPYTEDTLADLQKGEGGRADTRPDSKPDAKPDTRPETRPDPKPERPVAAAPSVPAVTPGTTVTATDDEKLSWMWPSDGKIVATFDEGKNKGIDIAGKAGQHVMAAGAGKVMYAGSGIRGYGNLVIVKHSNSLLSAYAHNRSIVVKEGQTVSKGQVIAEMGDSDADAVKLHFEIRQQGKPVDPARFLPNR